MPKVNNDDTRTTSIDVIQIFWDQCDTPHVTGKHLALSKWCLVIKFSTNFSVASVLCLVV